MEKNKEKTYSLFMQLDESNLPHAIVLSQNGDQAFRHYVAQSVKTEERKMEQGYVLPSYLMVQYDFPSD